MPAHSDDYSNAEANLLNSSAIRKIIKVLASSAVYPETELETLQSALRDVEEAERKAGNVDRGAVRRDREEETP